MIAGRPTRPLSVLVPVVFLCHVVYLWGFVVDDAFITFRYAQNLAAGRGLVFNPGERVEGYSSPLWTCIMAAAFKLGCRPCLAARVLGSLCSVGTLVLVCRMSRVIGGRLDPFCFIAALGLALNSSFVLWTVGCMETPLAALLVTAAAYCYVAGRNGNPHPAVWPLLALSALTRPEFALLLAITCVHRAIVVCRRKAGPPPAEIIAFLFSLALLGAHVLWRRSYYGDLLPNVFYAKRGGTLSHLFQGARYVYSFVVAYGHIAFLIAPLITLVVRGPNAPWLSYLCASIAGMVCFSLYAGGDWMPLHRFLVPVAPLAYLLIQESARDLFDSLSRTLSKEKAAAVVVVGVGLLLFSHSLRIGPAGVDRGAFEAEHRCHQAAAGWILTKAQPTDKIAVCDAGAYPFYTGLYTIDRRGLMDKHIARIPSIGFLSKYDTEYVLGQKPELIQGHLRLGVRLPRLKDPQRIPAPLQSIADHLHYVPRDLPLSELRNYSRWAGDYALYANPQFQAAYAPVVVYKIPDLWYVVLFARKVGGRRAAFSDGD